VKPILQLEVVLQPLLVKYLPLYKASNAMFIINFRCQAQHDLVTDGDNKLAMEEVLHLSSKKSLASEEFLLNEDNPMQKQNLTSLLRKVMQEESYTWDALPLLDERKGRKPRL
jgi:hypothetical protein